MIEIGKTYHILIPSGIIKAYKIHILAIVEDHIVYKWYGTHKQWWHYQIDHTETLEWKIEHAITWKNKRKKLLDKEALIK